jgi:hypothetical protein
MPGGGSCGRQLRGSFGREWEEALDADWEKVSYIDDDED